MIEPTPDDLGRTVIYRGERGFITSYNREFVFVCYSPNPEAGSKATRREDLEWEAFRDYRVPGALCPNCQQAMDGAAPTDGGRRPQTGDIALCFDCHHISVYGDNMQLRNLNDEEMVEIAGHPEIVRAMNALGEFKQHERDIDAQTPSGNRAQRRAGKSGLRRH